MHKLVLRQNITSDMAELYSHANSKAMLVFAQVTIYIGKTVSSENLCTSTAERHSLGVTIELKRASGRTSEACTCRSSKRTNP
jgi:hypothetical protein